MPSLRKQLIIAFANGEFERAAQIAAVLDQVGDWRLAMIARLQLAERAHDERLLSADALASTDDHIFAIALLTVYSIKGLAAVSNYLTSACKLNLPDAVRSYICALAEQVRLGQGKPLYMLRVAENVTAAMLPAAPVPVIKASVNGAEEHSFIIDTGAASTVLSRTFCDQKHIEYSISAARPVFDASANIVTAYPGIVRQFRLGNPVMENLPVFVMDLPSILNIAGVIQPLDSFRHQSLEIDMRRKVIELSCKDLSTWEPSPHEVIRSTSLVWVGTNLYIRGFVDSLPAWLLFDTGSSDNIVSARVARKIGHIPRATEEDTAIVASGLSRRFKGFQASLSVGNGSASESMFLVRSRWKKDPEQSLPLRRFGTLGSPWLKGRRLFIARGGRTMLFTEPENEP